MFQPTSRLVLAGLLLAECSLQPLPLSAKTFARPSTWSVGQNAFPENLPRNRAKTERVWLEREGATVGCIKIEDRRWCYEHIPQ